jgi:hypothetical protein
LELNLTKTTEKAETTTISYALVNIWKTTDLENFRKRLKKKLISQEIDENGNLINDELSFQQYLEKKLENILHAPAVEIKGRRDVSSDWIFKNPRYLVSLTDLGTHTMKIFRWFLENEGKQKKIYAIWSSGEWLFHKDCLAYKMFGKEVLKKIKEGDIELNAVFIKPNNYGPSKFSLEKIEIIHENLKKYGMRVEEVRGGNNVNIKHINWWKHNRIMTLLRIEENEDCKKQKGIYFRRRMATPLVSPVYLKDTDCDVLLEIFRKYYQKAQSEEQKNYITS